MGRLLLALDRVVGVGGRDALPQEALGRTVGLGDGGAVALAIHGELGVVEPAQRELTGLAGPVDRPLQQVAVDGRWGRGHAGHSRETAGGATSVVVRPECHATVESPSPGGYGRPVSTPPTTGGTWPPRMSPMLLSEMLELSDHGPDVFVGAGPQYPWGGLYGGQIVTQALWAAGRTVDEEMAPHSIRAYFIRRGDHTEPIRFEVDRIRNGRSFSTRRVVARQAVGAILNLEASFQRPEPSADIQSVSMANVPGARRARARLVEPDLRSRLHPPAADRGPAP